MKGLVYEGPGNVLVKDVPKPKPGKGEVLLKPLYTGICFSDVHAYRGGKFAEAQYRRGVVLGHEFGGAVVELGHGVEGLKVGDRVAIDPRTYCGECIMCRGGLYTQCLRSEINGWIGICSRRSNGEFYHGALTEYASLPAYECYKVPGSLSDMEISNVESLAIGTRAVRLSGIAIRDNVVILGADDYTLGVLQWVKQIGIKQVVLADPIKVRQDIAKKLGADEVIDPTATDFIERVRELMPFGADIAFISEEEYIKPSWRYLGQAIEIARFQGTVVVLRAHSEEVFQDIWPPVAWTKEIAIKHFGVFFGEEPWRGGKERGDFQQTIEALTKKNIDGESYVTRVVPFDEVKTKEDVDAIFQSLPEKEAKILFRIWGK